MINRPDFKDSNLLLKKLENDAMKQSFEYKYALLKEVVEELRGRNKYFYYSYDPASEKHKDFHLCGKKIRINEGANRAGKTTCAIQDVAMINLGEHPVYKIEVPNYWWVVVNNFKKVYETGGMLQKFKEVLPMNRIKNIVDDNKRNNFKIVYDNGSEIYFKSQEEGVDSFTSVKIHGALIDERIHDHNIRTQLRARIIDKDGLLIFTIDKLEDDDFISELGKQPYAKVFSFIMEDNIKYLPSGEIERLKTELDEIDREKILYGKHKERDILYLFPEKVWNESNFVEIVPSRFDISSNTELVNNEKGSLRLFKEPEQNIKYVIGLDTAEGTGKNSHCAQVINEYGEQVACWWSNNLHYTELDGVISALGSYFNNALIIAEYRSFGYAVIMKLKDYYPNLYYEVSSHSLDKKRVVSNFGIATNEKNKPEMVSSLYDNLDKENIMIHCAKTKKQLSNFVRDVNGKYRGLKEKEDIEMKFNDDDLVLALMFACRALVKYGYLRKRNNDTVSKYNSNKIYYSNNSYKTMFRNYSNPIYN